MFCRVRIFWSLVLVAISFAALPVVTEVPPALAADVTVGVGAYGCDEDGFDQALADIGSGDTIFFECDETTIIFNEQKTINKTVTIDGGGEMTLSGGESTRLFAVTADGELTLKNIAIVDGDAGTEYGGAIYDEGGSLTIQNSSFENNSANHGGAIYLARQQGSGQITNSTFAGNSAGFAGGAINGVDEYSLEISNSTFNDNTSGGFAGAIELDSRSSANIVNSTFVNNSANFGGAIDVLVSSLSVTSSTFAGNSASSTGGAINIESRITPAVVSIAASIFMNNTNNTCGIETAGSGGYNLSDDDSCGFDQDTDNNDGDANLGDLQNNGGPTETMLPQNPSDAVNAIPEENCPVSEDQRGTTRPQFGFCEIGAVEVRPEETTLEEGILCANRYNGNLRMPRVGACASTETLLELPSGDGIDLCVNRYNGDVRYSRTGACASTETAIQVFGIGGQSVCVNRYNGDLRIPRVEGQCASTETAQLI